MIAVGQWHVEGSVSQVWDANTLDLTHLTGMQAIVSFHMHKHGMLQLFQFIKHLRS